ncbi:hypothetical protein Poli38472_008006 [Pythium oligandrum]|uniref:L-dopachrome isomerase n=1 Tax=Pythium oligandrum TaxID=41045 RepID=A0A8K1CKT5_PYTOL|nr:hypothetical protein Poli38472_008006 [Pythium oligandrum]|eukprot:TMW65364.1 hypothetical protein Poli38472_008006 [Pythium oligandrum]
MPFVQISTNVKSDDVDLSSALQTFAEAFGEGVNRPLSAVMVHLELDRNYLLSESTEPCAFTYVRSSTGVNTERNPRTIELLTEAAQKALKVLPTRALVRCRRS